MKFNKTLRIATNSFNIKEQLGDNDEKGVIIEGLALNAGVPTRNRVAYTIGSIAKTHKTLVGKPLLNTHDDSKWENCLGHVVDAWVEGTSLMYRADIDPSETKLIEKLRRKDIPGVSVQVLVSDVTEKEDSFGTYIEAEIQEFLELSIVTIPGERDTTARLVESFNQYKKELNTSSGEGVIGPDGVFPKKKVLGKEQDGEEEDEDQRPLEPFDEPMSKQKYKDPEEQKQYKPLYDDEGNEVDKDKYARLVGKNETCVASRGLKCPLCSEQFMKDSFNDSSIQLRCYKCNYRIVQNKEKWKEYVTKAYSRLI